MNEKLKVFFDNHGVAAEKIGIDTDLKKFCDELEAGLRGNESSIAMIPAYLPALSELPKNSSCLAVDAGGTNLRIAEVSFDENGVPTISGLQKCLMPGKDRDITPEELFDFFAEKIEGYKSTDIGLCFSFKTEIMPDGDGKILDMSKEIRIRNVSGRMLSEEINKALVKRGAAQRNIIVTNDTCAAMLGAMPNSPDPSATDIGLILGTGMNICYLEKKENIKKIDAQFDMIINTEAGKYSGFPMGDTDIALCDASVTPAERTAEKMISGAYIGESCGRLAKAAAKEGLFSKEAAEKILAGPWITSPEISAFDEGTGRLVDICSGLSDYAVMDALIENTTERAARITALMLAGVLTRVGAKDRRVYIAAEGTTFWANRRLHNKLMSRLGEFAEELGLECDFADARDTTLIGSAVACAFRRTL